MLEAHHSVFFESLRNSINNQMLKMKIIFRVFIFALLVGCISCSKPDVYYIKDIDTFVSISKTHKGCFISFEKSIVKKTPVRRKDYILVPNISNLYIVYDSKSQNNLHIYCVEEYNTSDSFLEFNSLIYKLDLFPYSRSNQFFRIYYDNKIKKYKIPYKVITIGLRDNQVTINGIIVNEGNMIGKPS
jgi:hypothetical protein